MEEQLNQIGIVAFAAVLGAIVGAEREFADKPAGLRTHMFVCAASAMLMLLGDAVLDRFQMEMKDGDRVDADPLRIIQAIIVGISFLGAGTIIHHNDNRVEGLTTASTILLTAGVGIAVGAERYIFAIGISVLALIVLIIVGRVERLIMSHVAKKPSHNGD